MDGVDDAQLRAGAVEVALVDARGERHEAESASLTASSMSPPTPGRGRAGPARRRSPTRRIGQLLPPPARNCSQASLIRSAWPCVNMFMQESCE